MSTTTSRPEAQHHGPPGRGPLRKLVLSPASVALFLLFLGGTVLAVGVPAMIAPPQALDSATLADSWKAFAVSMAGLVVMAVAAGFLYARTKEIAMLILAIAPTTAVFVGAVVLLAMHGFQAAYPVAR